MADINPNDFIWSFSGKTGTKHVGRDSFDGHQTIPPPTQTFLGLRHAFPFFHLCGDWLPGHLCSVPILKKDVYQPLIKLSFLYYVPG